MKVSKQENLFAERAREKAASRRADAERIRAGVDPAQIQEENDAFAGIDFSEKSISNFAEALDW